MELNDYEGDASRLPATIQTSETAALDIIRTETVISRLPVHNLAKRGNVNIQILKTTADGKVELKWIVSYSDRYGQARQLAYKLDTIVINHHIDEQGRPVPQMICLGSLRDVADQLDLGGDTNKVRRALRQNASAFITAKFEYRGNDGAKKTLEADFTRYSVVFTGGQLPDGRRADAVYIILNEPYREVLNNAPVRPLDRAYMKELPPGAQRFYEIISYKIFSAIKNDYPHAKIAYSEYCTFSAQLRHYERQPVQDQMAKVIRPHKQSGYITAVRYKPTIDAENKSDWILYLTPGPKALAEFAAAYPRKTLAVSETRGGEHKPHRPRSAAREYRTRSDSIAIQPAFDPQLVTEFTRRGITEKRTRELLAHRKPAQDALAQLELGDQHIAKDPGKYTNPAGFYIHLVEENIPVPEGFETNARRKTREEEQRRRDEERRAQQELETEYEWYRDNKIERFIGALDPAEVTAVREAKRQEMEAQHKTPWIIDSFTEHETRRELTKLVRLMTIEEFKAAREQGSVLPSELVTTPVLVNSSQEQTAIDEVPSIIASTLPTPSDTPSESTSTSPHSAFEPEISKPIIVIEVASEAPFPETGHDHVDQTGPAAG